MKLTEEQLSDIELLLRQYWNGEKQLQRYKITENVLLTVDHTEDDEVVFAVSIADTTDLFEAESLPEELNEAETFETVYSQINTIIGKCISSNIVPISLYREPTTPKPMGQYIGTIPLKSVDS